MAIFPILLLVVLVIGAARMKPGKIRFGTPKVTHWLLIGYCGLLLASLAVSPFLRAESASRELTARSNSDREWEEYNKNLYSGKLEEINKTTPGYLKKKEKVEDFKFDTLEIIFSGDFGPQILVERDGGLKNEFDVFVYRGPLVVGGLNITDKVKPLLYEINGNTLEIPSETINFNIGIQNNSYPVRQFSGDPTIFRSVSSSESTIYLKVPESLKILTQGQIGIMEVKK